MKKLNVIWILIDSARNFETDVDDRGMPKVFSKFSDQCLYFKNVVTSAPSTIMSVSSIMTSSSSYMHSRTYDNFPGITEEFETFPNVLRKEGYNVNGVIYFKHGREVLSNLFGEFNKKFLPKGLSHTKPVWNNQDVYNVFKKLLDLNDWSIPSFNYLHYNVRVDDNVSDIVENTLDDIKAKGLFENSVIIINSDHGYPLPNKSWDWIEARKRSWGHDELLYNDNILTPVLIKYPNVKPQMRDEFVSTLDIIPSVLSILEIPISKKFRGMDLMLSGKETLKNRTLRTDNRFCGQLPQGISIIKNMKKLILFIDKEEKENIEIFDLSNDPKETNNLVNDPNYQDIKKDLYLRYEESENNFLLFHHDFLINRWKKHIDNLKFKPKSVAIFINSTNKFENLTKAIFQKLLTDSTVTLVNKNSDKNLGKIDLGITIIESEVPWHFKEKNETFRTYKINKKMFLDNNGINLGVFPQITLYNRYFRKRMKMILTDERYVFDILRRVFRKKLLDPVKA